jgi:hypothetical protein
MTTTAATAQLRQVSERDFQRTVTQLCDWLQLDWFHPLSSRGMRPGWPDLVIIGDRILYRELKSESGVVSAEQRRVGSRLTRAGADWAVWRPRDLRSGVVERQLRQLTPPPMLPFDRNDASERPAANDGPPHTQEG